MNGHLLNMCLRVRSDIYCSNKPEKRLCIHRACILVRTIQALNKQLNIYQVMIHVRKKKTEQACSVGGRLLHAEYTLTGDQARSEGRNHVATGESTILGTARQSL